MIGSKRQRRDRLVAALIAVVVLGLGVFVYVRSDERHTTQQVAAAAVSTLPALDTAPKTLTEAWRMQAPAEFAPVVSPYGVVVTGDQHTVTGYDAVTGDKRWTYERSNLDLCVLNTGDTTADQLPGSSSVNGIFTAYRKGDHCSEITLLNPETGDRLMNGSASQPEFARQRNAPMPLGSEVAFGGPHAAMIGFDLIEMWRFDLVRTIQYGNQPASPRSGSLHLGCDFTDIALAAEQFATIEHCDATSANAQLVINWDDPDNAPKGKKNGWDNFKHEPRGTVDLGVTDARIVGITASNVAVLIGGASPAIVVYSMVDPPEVEPTETTDPDGTGTSTATPTTTAEEDKPDPVLTEISRTAVDLTDAQVAAPAPSAKITPSTIDGDNRYSYIDGALVAITGDDLAGNWTLSGVRGTVAVVGDTLLVPVDAGIAVVDSEDGSIRSTIKVDRQGYTGRVDVHTAGDMVIESRGSTVVAYR